MKNILLLLVLLGGTLWQPSFAQGNRVSGKVTDAATGVGIPGANVQIKGTTTGTASDMDGNYSLTAAPDDVLLFSFVGYVQQEATVGSQNTINIQLSEDVQQLQEVGVVGYGTQEKRDATGAVESVKAEDFNQGVISSPEELIQGKSAGVQITQASGEPGGGVNIRIRGTSSVRGGNNPLFVVDGVPLAGNETQAGSVDIGRGTGSAKNPLNFLNPNDIASIDILKDASATAIYGARGANGVILITTKSGKGAAKKLEYGAQVSVSRPANTFNLLDRDEFIGALQQYD
ncbi:MAG: carboxypeptidase-like regulatory domain-containing protein, partial [Cyclobacteriaceae bacterium]